MVAQESPTSAPAWRAYVLASVGGVALFLGWAGFRLWPLELVCLIPLWAALERVADRRWKTALFVGWLYGAVAMAGGYHFMWEFTRVFSGFGALASATIFGAFSIYLGLQFGLQGLLYWMIRRRGWSIAVAAIPTLLLTEWLYPTLFPVYLGNALIEAPLLVQTVDLGGPLIASATVAAVNVVLFECLRAARGARGRPRGILLGVLLYLGVTLAYGVHRIAWVDEQVAKAPSLSVGLVQGNVSIAETQADPFARRRRYQDQTRELEEEAGPLDLIVWPEATFYPWLSRSFPSFGSDARADLKSPILFGTTTFVAGTKFRERFNSALIVDAEGLIGEVYDKNRLVMFGEYLPFGEIFPRLYELVPNSMRLTRGSSQAPLHLGPWRISTPICYEDILPALVRHTVREADPHVLVNLTNDGWFGDSQGAWIHLRLAQLRAIEHRRYLVRAANTGVTAIVDAAGRVVQRTAVGTRANLRGTVPMLSGQTLYAYLGDWPGWVGLVVTLGASTRRRRIGG